MASGGGSGAGGCFVLYTNGGVEGEEDGEEDELPDEGEDGGGQPDQQQDPRLLHSPHNQQHVRQAVPQQFGIKLKGGDRGKGSHSIFERDTAGWQGEGGASSLNLAPRSPTLNFFVLGTTE